MSLNDISQIRGPGIHTESHIVSEDITLTGIATASNFKTGSSNVHNVGIEIAAINVLGADTPIGHGSTIYNSGAAVFTGIVTAGVFYGDGSNLSGITAAGTGAIGGLTVKGPDGVVVGTAGFGVDIFLTTGVAGTALTAFCAAIFACKFGFFGLLSLLITTSGLMTFSFILSLYSIKRSLPIQ